MRQESGGGNPLFACADCFGYTHVHKFGHNPQVDTGTLPEDIWDGPASTCPLPAAAGAVTVVSSNGTDIGGGAGARTVRVFGLDANGLEITEDVTLNGLVPVALTKQYLRMYRAYVLTAGATTTNAGTISFTHAVAGVFCVIGAGDGQTLMAVYTVPSNAAKVALLSYNATIGKAAAAAAATVQLQTRSLLVANAAWRVREQFELASQGSSFIYFQFAIPLRYEAFTDIRLRCVAATASGLDISGGFDIVFRTP